jgi:hypothetical protein
MPRVNSVISDFSAGEIAPWYFGKVTHPIYYKGVSQMINFMPRPQGGFRKAPGTLYCGHTASNAVASLRAIKINSNLSYVLEFTNNLVRFWKFTNGALTYLAGKDIITTYTTAETSQLQVAWMYPDLFIAHQNHPPARIRWSTGDNFALQNINFVTTSYTFTATLVNGSATISSIAGVPGQTAVNLPLPSATQSGLWVLTDSTTPANIAAGTYITQVYPSATPSQSIAAASATLSAAAAGNGVGDTLVLTQATVPFQSAGNYPRCVSVAYQRVLFACTTNDPQAVWTSITGVWDSGDPLGAAGNMNMNLFEATTYQVQTMITDGSGNPTSNPPSYTNVQATQNAVTDSDGISATLTETESEIVWITGSHDLLLGCADGEIVIPANTASVVGLSPNNISDNMVSRAGSYPLQASVLVQGVVFIQLSGHKVYEMNWQGVQNQFTPPRDLSFFSSHLFVGNAITFWDYQQAPDTIANFLRADGSIAALFYNPLYEVMGWWQLKMHEGHVITSLAVQSGPQGDTVFLAVTRGAYNYIEQMTSADWTDVRLACYTDCSYQVYNAIPFATVTVDASFNGQTLAVVADGAYLGTAVPSGNTLTLPGGVKANYVTCGFLRATPTVKSMPISPEGKYGPGLTDMRNIHHVSLMLYNTLDVQVGVDGASLSSVPEVVAVNGANPTAYTGEPEPVPINTTNTRQPIFVVQSSAPLPCEVTAMIAEITNPS